MRTIDAEALKEDLKQYFSDGVLDGVSARLAFNQILHDIDNAPTVELFCAYLSDGEVRQPCLEAPCKHERRQGECEKCDFRKFTETFIDGVVDLMNKNGITSVEQLSGCQRYWTNLSKESCRKLGISDEDGVER